MDAIDRARDPKVHQHVRMGPDVDRVGVNKEARLLDLAKQLAVLVKIKVVWPSNATTPQQSARQQRESARAADHRSEGTPMGVHQSPRAHCRYERVVDFTDQLPLHSTSGIPANGPIISIR